MSPSRPKPRCLNNGGWGLKESSVNPYLKPLDLSEIFVAHFLDAQYSNVLDYFFIFKKNVHTNSS